MGTKAADFPVRPPPVAGAGAPPAIGLGLGGLYRSTRFWDLDTFTCICA